LLKPTGVDTDGVVTELAQTAVLEEGDLVALLMRAHIPPVVRSAPDDDTVSPQLRPRLRPASGSPCERVSLAGPVALRYANLGLRSGVGGVPADSTTEQGWLGCPVITLFAETLSGLLCGVT
jgi:hypothetical protein